MQQPSLQHQPQHTSPQESGRHPLLSPSPLVQAPQQLPRLYVLRLRGLPFSATAQQVVEFFGSERTIVGGAEVGSHYTLPRVACQYS